MRISDSTFDQLISQVRKPGRYLGGEYNSVRKDLSKVKTKVALVFPDAYEVGESHLGLKILYKILNDQEDIFCDRVYAPWYDMEELLRKESVPLFALESRLALKDFDVIGFCLPYELVYTNILQILDLAGIPFLASERKLGDPILIAGGNNAFNPEPVAEIFDAIVVGDAEELILPLVQEARLCRTQNSELSIFREKAKQYPGVYVPAYFEFEYDDVGKIIARRALDQNYTGVFKASVGDLNQAAFPSSPIVPHIQTVHDRIGVEIQRGCVRMCRFCQAGMIYRPERQRSPETVKNIVRESLKNTGHEEVSLLSLSAGDYACASPLLDDLFNEHEQDRVNIGLPATRTETLGPQIISQIKRGRINSFTVAPEAGTARMRRVINKGNETQDLLNTAENVFKAGFDNLKLYYMCNLPFEGEADLQGIVDEAYACKSLASQYSKRFKISVSVSSFVPKPFTPFQWASQQDIATTFEKYDFFRGKLRHRSLQFKKHDAKMSYLEGVFSRGDRRLLPVIIKAFEKGARFDSWDEGLRYEIWEESFQELGLDPKFYVQRERDREEILPWDHLFVQMKKEWLWEEWEKASQEAFTEDCSTHTCADCGVCDFRTIKNVNYALESKEFYAFSTRGRKLKREESGIVGQSSIPAEKPNLPLVNLRVAFKKVQSMAYLGHLELQETLHRAVRRAKIPVRYTQGFHPRAILKMGLAQPVGVESLDEYFDIELTKTMDPLDFQKRLNQELPAGLEILSVRAMWEKVSSLNESLSGQVYYIESTRQSFDQDFLDKVDDFFQGREHNLPLWVEKRRKGEVKKVDLNPLIAELKLEANNRLKLVTRHTSQGGVKPHDIVLALHAKELEQFRFLKVQSLFH